MKRLGLFAVYNHLGSATGVNLGGVAVIAAGGVCLSVNHIYVRLITFDFVCFHDDINCYIFTVTVYLLGSESLHTSMNWLTCSI